MKRLPIILIIAAIAFACGEEQPDQQPGGDEGELMVTAAGTPIGDPVTKKIGAAGGTIISADGFLELTIPAGAVGSDTDITMQPVSNERINAIGNAFDLLPDGMTFSTPVTLTFHYTDEDVNGTSSEYLNISYQDSENSWVSDIEQQRLDSIGKTIALDVTHFTDFSLATDLPKIVGKTTLYEGESTTYYIAEVYTQEGTDQRALTFPVPDEFIADWKINGFREGSPTVGAFHGSGAHASYTTPDNIEYPKHFRISASIFISVSYYVNGTKYTRKPYGPSLNITVLPAKQYNYKVAVAVVDSTLSGFWGIKNQMPIYRDNATFDLSISLKNRTATMANLKNEPPTVTPPTKDYRGSNFTWLADPNGEINIERVVMVVDDALRSDSILVFQLLHISAFYPGFLTKSAETGEIHSSYPPYQLADGEGVPNFFNVDLKKKVGHFDKSQGVAPGSGVAVTVHLEPIE